LSIGEGGIGLGPVREIADGVVIARNSPGLFNAGQYDATKMYRDSRVQKIGPNTFLTPEAAISGDCPSRPDIVAQLDSALAAQTIFPIATYAEMRGQPGTNELADAASNEDLWAGIMLRLVGDGTPANPGIEEYIQMFQVAYPEVTDVNDFNIGHLGSAIAAYIRQAFQARYTPLDRFIEGEDDALSDIAKIGASVFLGKGRCFVCHNGPHLSNFSHFAVAVPQIGPGVTPNGDDKGRLEATGIFRDVYKFRTPTLRNVSLTGPYMHDGAFTDLTQVTDHYDNLLLSLDSYDGSQIEREEFLGLFEDSRVFNINRRNATLIDALIVEATPLKLTDAEKVGLTTFLEEGLTDTSSLDSHVIPTDVPSGLPVD
jgi:cytochrome c peroxidase